MSASEVHPEGTHNQLVNRDKGRENNVTLLMINRPIKTKSLKSFVELQRNEFDAFEIEAKEKYVTI